MLFLLLWGEAANLRHAPECLCYIFYCMSNALLLRTTPARDGLLEKYPTADSPGHVAHVPEHFKTAQEGEFLQCIVRPLYDFLKEEVLKRKDLTLTLSLTRTRARTRTRAYSLLNPTR